MTCVDWINYNCYNYYCDKKHYIDNTYKRAMCTHWMNNKCRYSSNTCTYAHGEYDIYTNRYHNYNYKSRDRSRSRSRDKLKLKY